MHRALPSIVPAIAMAVTLALPGESEALSCVGITKANAKGAFLRADGAISGKVVGKRSAEVNQGNGLSTIETVTIYRIGRAFKKKRRLTPGTRVKVSGWIDQREGSRGGIFLDRRDGRWMSSSCSQIDRKLLRQTARKLGRI